MNVSDDVARWIRTGVPIAVGFAFTWLASTLHVVIGPSSKAGLVDFATAAVTAAYYALARLVEARWPQVGKYLLGAPKPSSAPVVQVPLSTPPTPPAPPAA